MSGRSSASLKSPPPRELLPSVHYFALKRIFCSRPDSPELGPSKEHAIGCLLPAEDHVGLLGLATIHNDERE